MSARNDEQIAESYRKGWSEGREELLLDLIAELEDAVFEQARFEQDVPATELFHLGYRAGTTAAYMAAALDLRAQL